MPGFLPLIGHRKKSLQYWRDAALAFKGEPCAKCDFKGTTIWITNRKHIKFIFQHKDTALFQRDFDARARMYDFLGDGIFNVDGYVWQWHRKLGTRLLSGRVFEQLMFDKFQKNCESFISKCVQLQQSHSNKLGGAYFDLFDMIQRCVMNALCEVTLGLDFNIIAFAPNPHPLAKAFDDTLDLIYRRFDNSAWQMTKKLGLSYEKPLQKQLRIINQFVRSIIVAKKRSNLPQRLDSIIANQSREELTTQSLQFIQNISDNKTAATGKKGAKAKKKRDSFGSDRKSDDLDSSEMSGKSDMLSMYFALDPNFTTDQMRDILVNLIFGAKDPLSITLGWFFWEIFQNPKVIKKVITEIDSIDKISIDNCKRLKYVEFAILETLRLHPLQTLQRIVNKDVTLPNGGNNSSNGRKKYTLRKGDRIMIDNCVMGRANWIWKSSDQFMPERFSGKKSDKSDQYSFPVFGVMPRCLGRNITFICAKIIIWNVLKSFTIVPKPGKKPQTNCSGYYETIADGFYAHFKRRPNLSFVDI